MGVRLPAEYQEVEYLESPGLCYVGKNIQLYAGDSLSSDVVFQILDAQTEQWVAGSFISVQRVPEFGIYNGVWYTTNGASYTSLAGSGWTGKYKGLIQNVAFSSDRTIEWGIFGRGGVSVSNTINRPACRIWKNTVYVNDIPAIDWIPCYRKSDSEPGMYDLVSGAFFTNAGTGEFVVGPDVVNHISPRLMDRRRALIAKLTSLLEYIATSENGVVRFNANVSKPTTVICEVTPKQDLHGYDHPWPAGGGKNLFDSSNCTVWAGGGSKLYNSEIHGTVTQNGEEFTNTSRDSNFGLKVYLGYFEAGTYTFSVQNKSSNGTIHIVFTDSAPGSGVKYRDTISASSSTALFVTFTMESAAYVYGGIYANNTTDLSIEYLQLELGSTATSYAPYENICPIEGYDEVNVEHRGANLLLPQWFIDNGLTQDATDPGKFSGRIALINGINILPKESFSGGQFTIKGGITGSCSVNVEYTDGASTLVSLATIEGGYTSNSLKTVKKISIANRGGSSATTTITNLQLVRGKSVPNVYTTNGTTLPLTFNQSGDHAFLPIQEGTGDPSPENVRPIHPGLTFTRDDDSVLSVYGGTLTVNADGTGSLVSNELHTSSLAGLSWSQSGSQFFTSIGDIKLVPVNDTSIICSKYATAGAADGVNRHTDLDKIIFQYANRDIIVIRDTSYSTVADFKTGLDNIETYYLSAAPITYTLSVTETNRALEALGLTQHIGPLYGGTITINPDESVDVEVAYQKISFDGSENWSVGQSGTERWFYRIATPYSAPTQYPITESVVSNMYPVVPISSTGDGSEKGCYLTYNGDMRIRWGTQDLNKFKALLTEVPLEYVYPLATPQTYHFSNLEQLKTFLGENNFWCDISDDITVKYWNRG